MSFGTKQFYKVTPKKVLKIADSIKATCAIAASYSIISDNKFLVGVSVALLIVADFASRLFGKSQNVE